LFGRSVAFRATAARFPRGPFQLHPSTSCRLTHCRVQSFRLQLPSMLGTPCALLKVRVRHPALTLKKRGRFEMHCKFEKTVNILKARFIPLRALVLATMAFSALFFASKACAQSRSYTSVTGTVVDPSGAVVPGAAVEIHNPVSQFDRTTTTDSSGAFSIQNIPFNP